MKKDNPMLKNALEEAARQELASLPEERQIIRPYSDKFEKDMHSILGVGTPAVKHKRPRVRVAALIAAVLVICLTLTAGAATVLIGTGSVDYDVEGAETNNATIKIPEQKWLNKDGTISVVPETTEERELDVLAYNGDEIRAVFTINSEKDPMFKEQAIFITLNGIRQKFTVKCGEEIVKDTMLYAFNVEPLTEKKVYISFTPNVGKAGDELQFTTYLMYNPNVELKEKGDVNEMVSYHHQVIDIGYKKLIMNVDAPSQTLVAKEFSGKTVLPVQDRVIKSYSEMESEFYIFAYSDIDDFFTEDGFYTRMYVKETGDEDITLTVLGDGGTYRLSLYVNNELMPVFDGCDYIDIETSEENQTDLRINLDTTKLKDVNSCYVL